MSGGVTAAGRTGDRAVVVVGRYRPRPGGIEGIGKGDIVGFVFR